MLQPRYNLTTSKTGCTPFVAGRCYNVTTYIQNLVGMWVGFALDENIRGVILLRRWRSGKWRSKGFVSERK